MLTLLERVVDESGLHYKFVDVQFNREARTATITVRTPESATENTIEKALNAGANWWPLQMARELDDAILPLRASELDLGLWLLKTTGNPGAVLASDDFLLAKDGPLSDLKPALLKSVEVNLQTVRWPSTVPPSDTSR